MSTRRSAPTSRGSRLASSTIFCALSALLVVHSGFTLQRDDAQQESRQPISVGHRIVVVLLDVNSHQDKILPVEQELAEGVVRKLAQPGNVFSVITFGAQASTLSQAAVPADEAIAAIRNVRVGNPRQDYLSTQLYDALDRAFSQFIEDRGSKSLLVITEGNDYPRGKTFKQTVSRAQQLQVTCNVALVAGHTFYGSKATQRYGFYLRRLAGKTHGRYVEVGKGQKRISRSIERLADGVLGGPRC